MELANLLLPPKRGKPPGTEETENAHVTFVTPVSFLSMQKLLLEVVHTQIKLTTPSNTSKQLRVKKRVVYCK